MTSGTSSGRMGCRASAARPRAPIRRSSFCRSVTVMSARMLGVILRRMTASSAASRPRRAARRRRRSGSTRSCCRAAGATPARAAGPSTARASASGRSGSPPASGSGRAACPSSCPSSPSPDFQVSRRRSREKSYSSWSRPKCRTSQTAPSVTHQRGRWRRPRGRAPTARAIPPTKRPEWRRAAGAYRPRSSQPRSGGMSSTVVAPGEQPSPGRRSRRTAGSRGTAWRPATRRRRPPPAPPTASPSASPTAQAPAPPRRLPLPARLEVPGQLDDAEVDPVADDDRAQERRVRVELGDPERRQAGQAEGVDGATAPAAGTAPGCCASSRRTGRWPASTATTTSTDESVRSSTSAAISSAEMATSPVNPTCIPGA